MKTTGHFRLPHHQREDILSTEEWPHEWTGITNCAPLRAPANQNVTFPKSPADSIPHQRKPEMTLPTSQSCEPELAASEHFQPQSRLTFAFRIRMQSEAKPDRSMGLHRIFGREILRQSFATCILRKRRGLAFRKGTEGSNPSPSATQSEL
jgi:hypothetical protein